MNPMKAVLMSSLGAILVIVFLIITMPYLAGLGFLPAATSTAITSTGNNYNAELPYIALLILGGISIKIAFGNH